MVFMSPNLLVTSQKLFKYFFIWLYWILVAAREPCCSVAYGILVPHQGLNPDPLQLPGLVEIKKFKQGVEISYTEISVASLFLM